MSKYVYSIARGNDDGLEGMVSVAYSNDFSTDTLDLDDSDNIETILHGIGLTQEDEINFGIPDGEWNTIKPQLDACPLIKYSDEFQQYCKDNGGSIYEFDY